MPDKIFITREDIMRLIRILESQHLRVKDIEVRSLDDLEPEIRLAVGEHEKFQGRAVLINPSLRPKTFRVFPAIVYRISGRMVEWSVRERGPVPATIDVDDGSAKGYKRLILDHTEAKEEP